MQFLDETCDEYAILRNYMPASFSIVLQNTFIGLGRKSKTWILCTNHQREDSASYLVCQNIFAS